MAPLFNSGDDWGFLQFMFILSPQLGFHHAVTNKEPPLMLEGSKAD